jgi:aquaporin Z
MPRYLTEFIGTFFLVLTIALTVMTGNAFAPIAIGAGLMVMVYMGGHVSGAHYNPAVSLAVLLRGALPPRDVLPYLAAQFLGAVAATLLVGFMLDRTVAPALGPDGSPGGGVVIEFLYTFALALVVLNVATSPRTTGNSYYGLAIGITITVGVFAGGPISGGAFNPAVGIGMGVVHALLSGGETGHLWIYLVGPFLGAALAALVFRVQEGKTRRPEAPR